jgi:hypothetical protein
MPTRISKPALDDSDADEVPPADSPEKVVERERAERSAEVVDEWWYRDRYGEGQLLRFRLEAVDCDVTLQTFCDGEFWVTGWPATKKVPLYRADEIGGTPIFVVQGEHAVDAAIAMGLSAVTSAGGPEDVERSDWQRTAGRPVVIAPTNCDEGRAYGRAVARRVLGLDPPAVVRMLELPGLEEGDDIGSFLWNLKISDKERVERIRQLAEQRPVMKMADTLGGPVMEPTRDVVARPVRWLWPGRVPIGKPIVVFGGCNPGKSVVALDLAARVSAGADWPDSRGTAPCGNVILMCRQDNLADTVRPRLDRAGAAVERIIALNRVTRVIGDQVVRRNITLGDLQDLERAIEIAGNVRLVVIDPLSAYLGGGMPSARQIGPIIDGLTDLAERYGLAVVLTAEFGGRDGLGSGATMTLTSAVRMAWMLAPVPGPVDAPVPSGVEVAEAADALPGTRMLLVPVKSSLGDPGGGLALRIGDHDVEWEPATIAISNAAKMLGQAGPELALPEAGAPDRSLIAPPRPVPKSPCRQSAAQWLQEQLAAGPVPVGTAKKRDGTLRASANAAGMAWTTVRRAFVELGGVREKCPITRKQMWRLPVAVLKE